MSKGNLPVSWQATCLKFIRGNYFHFGGQWYKRQKTVLIVMPDWTSEWEGYKYANISFWSRLVVDSLLKWVHRSLVLNSHLSIILLGLLEYYMLAITIFSARLVVFWQIINNLNEELSKISRVLIGNTLHRSGVAQFHFFL